LIAPGILDEAAFPHLVLGGARSGKSNCAEMLISRYPAPRIYVATAEVLDDEMAARIRDHQQRRGTGWETVEAPRELTAVLQRLLGNGKPVLVDCLTVWLSNLLLAGSESATLLDEQLTILCDLIRAVDYPLVLVSNEVGSGIVPDNALARRFRDVAGRANQLVAAACAGVTLVVAGLPLTLKALTVRG
jgi:adenosylcobinamide kinase/adenosylcobinamide-phosphate guanylyltransferase